MEDWLKSKEAKKVLAGAAIGAVIAVPVPFVGPFAGAIVGGGIMAFKYLMRD